MPFKFRIKRTRRYEVSNKQLYVVCVQLLDSTLIECTLRAESTGRECVENISQRIELKETQYFGLRYFNKSLQLHWLDLDRPLKKQVDKNDHCPSLYFGVMLYVNDVNKIMDDMARYQYYLQLKHDILECQLPCTARQAVVLASYSIQAEFGDHDYGRHNPEYFKEYAILPKSMTNNDLVFSTLMQQVMTEHQNYSGVAPTTAELQYIMAAMQLDGYGVECYPAKNDGGADMILGVALAGLLMKLRSGQSATHLRWDDIHHLTHNKKTFLIQTADKKNLQLHMDDSEVAKYAWRMCVTQHTFYRRQKSVDSCPDPLTSQSMGSQLDFREPAVPDIQQTTKPSPVAVRSEIIVHHASKSSPDIRIQYAESSAVPYQSRAVDHVNAQTPPASPAVSGSAHAEPERVSHGHTSSSASVYNVSDGQVILGSLDRLDKPLIVPPYRPSPDYETVMRQRQYYQVRESHALESALSHSQSINLEPESVANIGSSGVYSRASTLAYSQPDVHYSSVVNNRGYIAYSHPVHAASNSNSRPVERVSSLIIQPTYSTPDLNAHLPCDYSASESMINASLAGHVYRHPPAYYRTSSSTPDLASHPAGQEEGMTSGRENLISGRNVDLSAFITQSRLDKSLDNLAEDVNELGMKPRDGLSSSSSNATFHAKDDVEYDSPDGGSELEYHPEPEPDYSEDSLNDSLDVDRMLLYQQTIQHEAGLRSREAGALGQERDLVDYVVAESQRLEAAARQDSGSGDDVVMRRPDRERRHSDVRFSDDVTVISTTSQDQTELTRSGDDDVDGLQTANVNGLSISRAQLMFMQKDESRAPKDDRRKVLESKLEDGQVNAEFEKIPRKVSTADCSIALMPENLFRNRFKDIHPYDSSRVRLKPKSDNPMGYINASHVRVRVKSQELWYLSAQGPLSDTIADFWQMVWEQDVQVIAMLTDIKELGKEKCAQYWPLSPGNKHRMTYGDFVVSLQFRNDSGCFVTSGLNLHNKAEAKDRMIWHLQFTDWPDHGCPDDVHGFLAYLEEIESVQRHIVMENQDMKALPILVHCSAGVGRTGVAILVEVMKTCLEFNQNVDVATVLATLRGQRMHMVQMVGQYTFVYKTLIQYLKNSRLI